MRIKVLEKKPGCMPEIIKVGDWIDLCVADDCTMRGPAVDGGSVRFDYQTLSLGVVIEIPKGYEAMLLPRSSTFKKWGVIFANGEGVIDQSYCGQDDVWRFPALSTRGVTIPSGTPIAQFRIQLSQKATLWQKIKWLFSSKIQLVKVSEMSNPNRGGIGTGSDKYRTRNSCNSVRIVGNFNKVCVQ